MPVVLSTILASSLESVLGKFLEKHLSEIPASLSLAMAKLSFTSSFAEYINRSYDTYSIINQIVFCNQQTKLKDVYVPLSLVETGSNPTVEHTINNYPKDLIKQYRRILIKDTAGMGKSTLLRYMFLSEIDGEERYPIPFYIELRRLTGKHSLLDEIRNQLNSLKKEFNKELMLSLFQDGGFIFYLDGYDEIALSDRDAVTKDLKDFIAKASENFYVLSSRDDTALTDFGDFKLMNIRPLSKSDVFELLRRYDREGSTAESLIDELDSGQYDSLKDFLKNPLLVSLLYRAYAPNRPLPQKKHIFYEQVFESLFGIHGSNVRPKKTGLSVTDFHKVLRAIGFVFFLKGKDAFRRLDFDEVIKTAQTSVRDIQFDRDDLIYDLLYTVPLFSTDGVYYQWVHRSIQEYFAAEFIRRDSGNRKEKIVSSIRKKLDVFGYENLLDLYSDIDPSGFESFVLFPFLQEYISFVDRSLESIPHENHKIVELFCGMSFGRNLRVRISSAKERKEFEDSFLGRHVVFFTKKESCRGANLYFESRKKGYNNSYPVFQCWRFSYQELAGSLLDPEIPDKLFYLKLYFENSADNRLYDLIARKYPNLISKEKLDFSLYKPLIYKNGYTIFCSPRKETEHQNLFRFNAKSPNDVEVLGQVVMLLQRLGDNLPVLDYDQSVNMLGRIKEDCHDSETQLDSLLDQLLAID